MADSLTLDLLQASVTSDDAGEYQGNGVVNLIVPWYMSLAANMDLPTKLPPRWNYGLGLPRYFTRDTIARSTIYQEPFWNMAVAKAAAKSATRNWDIKGGRGVDRWHDMIMDFGVGGFIPSQKRGIVDYMCTGNGEHWEIVRASSAAGSRILGFVHLDSLRTVRTNDPEIVALFWDLKGRYHELRNYQVIMMCDMPDNGLTVNGIGSCAAEGIYNEIYKTAAINRYLTEKVSGTGATALDFVMGLNSEQIKGIVDTAKNEAVARGMTQFQGHVIAGILSQVDMKHVQINLRDLPDGFDRKQELLISLDAYANRLGIDPQELHPELIGQRSLGTSVQSVVLHEKQEGSILASRDAEFAANLNMLGLPNSVTFYWSTTDIREDAQKAQNALTRAQERAARIAAGELSAQEARQIAVEANDMPRELVGQDMIDAETIGNEEKPIEDAELQPGAAQPQQPAAPQAQPTTQISVPAATQKEIDALVALKESIDVIREKMHDASTAQPQWLPEQMKAQA